MTVATATRERPILFSGPMVKAILDGRKTQTRRVAKLTDGRSGCDAGMICLKGHHATPARDGIGLVWRPYGGSPEVPMPADRIGEFCPHGGVGDLLWVRETFAPRQDIDPFADLEKARRYALYAADGGEHPRSGGHWHDFGDRWIPPIHMPRWASRITLEITDVRVQRIKDISVKDAEAEGVEWNRGPMRAGHTNPISAFHSLWNGINGKRLGCGWELNPWVWALSFRRI